MKTSNPVDTIDHIITHGVKRGILHLSTDDDRVTNNVISVKGREMINFGSCSYLGLEFDERLREGAIDAVRRFGTQFSESRAYVSLSLYREAESLLEGLFGSPCLITPTTTLGHIANLPVLIEDGDAVILDQQVHASVQTAARLAKTGHVHVELLRHNRLDLLEDRITTLQAKHKKIWYLADGIYSMYGDGCPVDEIYGLLNRYPSLHFYVDDAHGVSLWGENGRGYVLNGRYIHERMVVAVSLAKSFATGGAVMVYPNREMARKVRTCGGPLITSGPVQPAILGAIIAAARIHLSDEIYSLQRELRDRITFTNGVIRQHHLPLVSASDAGIFFIGTGLPKIGYDVVEGLMREGFYVNLGIFPAVPIKNTGIRFTITRLHSCEQISRMVSCLANLFFNAVPAAGFSLAKIRQAFKMPEPSTPDAAGDVINGNKADGCDNALFLQHYNAIRQVDKTDWDLLFRNRGTFDAEGLQSLEDTFTDNPDGFNNWQFDYLLIRDRNSRVVLATLLTTALWKDDMLSSDIVSRIVEKERQGNPYHLTSKVMSAGSLLTEGEHLYVDRTHPRWKEALVLLFETMSRLGEEREASSLVLRDFHDVPDEVNTIMIENGYVRMQMPETYIRSGLTWCDDDAFYTGLSRRSRQHFREDIRRYASGYGVTIVDEPVAEAVAHHWYSLYREVKDRSYTLNTWPLPQRLFNIFLQNRNWEVIQLTWQTPEIESVPAIVSFVLCYKAEQAYIPMLIGIDYRYNNTCRVYRQALYQILRRARELGKERVLYGFGAGTEKRKMGAVPTTVFAYVQSRDHFNSQTIAAIAAGSGEAALYAVKSTELLS